MTQDRWATQVITPWRHEPTDACLMVHCHTHDVDEPEHDAYRVCGECSHVFPTAADLLADHATLAEELNRWAKPDPFAINSPGMLEPKTEPETIHVCPHCAHDF